MTAPSSLSPLIDIPMMGPTNKSRNNNNSAKRPIVSKKTASAKHTTAPTIELAKNNLNVSRGGKFYERAKSRRSRHRDALMSTGDSKAAVPLGKSRRRSSSSITTNNDDDDHDDIEKKFEHLGKHRISRIAEAHKNSARSKGPPTVPTRTISLTTELEKRNLNVSRGGSFYERAKSRQSRHRESLMSMGDSEAAVPLGTSRRRSSSSITVNNDQDDDDDVEKRFEHLGKYRISRIVDSNKNAARYRSKGSPHTAAGASRTGKKKSIATAQKASAPAARKKKTKRV